MSDIFISYKRDDRPRAKLVARKLEEQGFSVWWDRNIPPGKSFDRVIQEALDQAQCVLVLWSEASVASDWVKEEAEKGASRGILVPVLIDDVPIPLGFGRLQTANLVGWQGEKEHPEFVQVTRSIQRIVNGNDETFLIVQEALTEPAWGTGPSVVAPLPEPRRPAAGAPPSGRRRRSRTVLWTAAAVALAVATGGAGYFLARAGSVNASPIDGIDIAAAPGDATETRQEPPTGDASPALNPNAPADGPASQETGPEETAPEETVPEETGPATQDLTPAAPTPAEETVDPALEAYRRLSELQERAQDADADAEQLLRDYQELWSEHRASLDADAANRVLRTIESLQATLEEAEAVEALEQREDLPLHLRLASLRELAAGADGRTGALAAEKIAELEKVVESSATITADENFVTCERVSGKEDGRRPIGVRQDFRPGNVYVFARVNAPRPSEKLTLQWIDADGTVARAQTVTVQRNTRPGYRLYYAKGHSTPGHYEVRLLNDDGMLIGRRGFDVR